MDPPSRFSRAFLLLWLVTFLGYFAFQLLTASLPLYALTLGADDAAIGLLTGIIALASLASRPWVGRWLDRGGARWGMLAGASFYALAAIGFGISHTVPQLIAFRTFSGVAIALSSTSSQVLAIALAPERRWGESLSLLGLATSIGQGAGPAIGIAVASRLSYAGLFAVSALFGVASISFAVPLRTIAPTPRQSRTNRLIHTAVLGPGLMLIAIMLTFGVNFGLLAVHASRRGLSNPGLAFAAYAVGQILVQGLLRRLSDRLGRSAAIGPGLMLSAVGMWSIALVSGWWLLVAALMAGVGQGMAQPAIHAWGSDLVAAHERGSAMGTLGVFLEIGIAAGAIGGGVVGRTFGLRVTYLLAGGVAATAAIAQGWILRRRRVGNAVGSLPLRE